MAVTDTQNAAKEAEANAAMKKRVVEQTADGGTNTGSLAGVPQLCTLCCITCEV